MTTCIIDPKKRMIYADDMQTTTSTVKKTRMFGMASGETVGDIVSYAQTEKIRRTEDGYFVVGAGESRTIRKFAACYPNNLPDAPRSSTTIIVCRLYGDTLRMVRYQSRQGFFFRYWRVTPIVEDGKPIVIGSGREYAAGALAAGVSPAAAIKAASVLDPYTSANVNQREIIDIHAPPKDSNAG